MKIKLLFFLTIFSFCFAYSQVEVKAGMGINYLSMPSLYDYINTYYASSSDQVPTFSSAINGFIEVNYPLQKNFYIGLEGVYSFSSFTYFNIGRMEMQYDIIKASAMAYYVISGTGYDFKLGGGVGPRFTTAKETFTVESFDYNSVGFGFLLKTEGNTLLSGNLYANINASLGYDFLGTPKSGDRYIYNDVANENVNLNNLSLGVGLGLTYKF
ncbi:MAG: hypothetical protein ACM3O3_05795 [Syntrophothermus sp.]